MVGFSGGSSSGGSDGGADTDDSGSSGSGWEDEDTGTLWNNLAGIADKLTSIVNSFTEIPGLIYEKFTDILTTISERVQSVVDAITSLPSLILEGIKDIFVPDTVVIEQEFNTLLDNLQAKMGITNYDLDNLFSGSAAPTNINGTFNFGLFQFTGTFVDFSFLIKGVEHFRPFIRGFIVLLLLFFNMRMALNIFGLSSGEIQAAADANNKKEK